MRSLTCRDKHLNVHFWTFFLFTSRKRDILWRIISPESVCFHLRCLKTNRFYSCRRSWPRISFTVWWLHDFWEVKRKNTTRATSVCKNKDLTDYCFKWFTVHFNAELLFLFFSMGKARLTISETSFTARLLCSCSFLPHGHKTGCFSIEKSLWMFAINHWRQSEVLPEESVFVRFAFFPPPPQMQDFRSDCSVSENRCQEICI